MDYIAQAIGIAAMCFNILCFQAKEKKKLAAVQTVGTTLFFTHYLLLGAYSGAASNIISATQDLMIVTMKKPRKWPMYIFIGFTLTIYVLNFAVFGVEFNIGNVLLNLLPTISSVLFTIAFFTGDGNMVRKCVYICSPCWLLYNIFNGSIGGIICECFVIISTTIALIRFRGKK